MRRIVVVAGAAVVMALVSARADAASISFGSTTLTTTCTTNDNTNFGGSQVLTQVAGCFGASLLDPLTLLYKQDVGASSDSGLFSTSYSTTFANTPTDPKDGKVTYVGGSSMDCLACYLVVKDGNHSPAQYFFNISSWNGTDAINLIDFWPQGGAISNIAIWGQATAVPEPATLLLVGSGLGLAALKRRRRLA